MLTCKTIRGLGLLLMILSVVWLSCSREDAFMRPQKIVAESVDTPDIFIQEAVSSAGETRYFATDTVLPGNGITISTPNRYDQYRWKVGNDPRIRKERKFTIYFRQRRHISVRLVGLNGNDESDTFHSDLTVVNSPYDPQASESYLTTPLVDTWRGHNKSNPDHQFKIWFGYYKGGNGNKILAFYNLPEGCPEYSDNSGDYNYGAHVVDIGFKAFTYESAIVGCRNTWGWGRLKANREKLVVNYSFVDSARENRLKKTFISKR